MERPIVSVVEIDPSDELNEFIRDFLKKRRAEDAGFAEIDRRLKAQERRIAELEEELEEYKAAEYDRFCIFHITQLSNVQLPKNTVTEPSTNTNSHLRLVAVAI